MQEKKNIPYQSNWNQNNPMYGILENYKISANTEAADFLEKEVQKFFNYTQNSKRQKYADIWLDDFTGINVKTDNLCSKQNKGRLCTAEINQWLIDERNNLKFLFIEYENNMDGEVKIVSIKETFIEEVEYEIYNQGRGLLQPKRFQNKIVFREKISRKDWLDEFRNKYSIFVDNQIKRFEDYRQKWC